MRNTTMQSEWPVVLTDPSGRRAAKPRKAGRTMVLDKGLGLNAFEDLLNLSGEYIDIVKLGFGTSPLYPTPLLRRKIELAAEHGIAVIPGGTLLEAAVRLDVVPGFLRQALALRFTGIEVSDGTIRLERGLRDELIRDAKSLGLQVFTEYGKKQPGSRIDFADFSSTLERDLACGADLVTVEARESGIDVGLFDEKGSCREEDLLFIRNALPNQERILWEAPLKEQQVVLLRAVGPQVNLGNVSFHDVLALETMRRGLRSDTFDLQRSPYCDYMI
ncbi:phosphosulfolactate synthase [Cohnella cellulosilytica]|uniref:Phosphosulfolactate synthase n=1 Tax=Cohnella cellulosilytica TaxID=986710 RepID=A0ABW2F5X7_9BACL